MGVGTVDKVLAQQVLAQWKRCSHRCSHTPAIMKQPIHVHFMRAFLNFSDFEASWEADFDHFGVL